MRRRWLYIALFAGMLLLPGVRRGLAQEAREAAAASDTQLQWKLINTAIFAVGLGYFLWKYAPAFFNARSADIQKAIKEATGLKMEADLRYSEIDRKMAHLAEEVKKMRAEAQAELERDHERFRHETQLEIGHIQHNVIAEIEAFRQEGMDRIRRHTAQLAMERAERRLQERLASGERDDSIQDFIHLVERGRG